MTDAELNARLTRAAFDRLNATGSPDPTGGAWLASEAARLELEVLRARRTGALTPGVARGIRDLSCGPDTAVHANVINAAHRFAGRAPAGDR